MTFFSGKISRRSGELVRFLLQGTGLFSVDCSFDLGNQTKLCQKHWGSTPECHCSVRAGDLSCHSKQGRCCCPQRCPSRQHDGMRGNIYVAPQFRRDALERAIAVPARHLPRGDTAEDRKDLYYHAAASP
jgi:hypothetical protein